MRILVVNGVHAALLLNVQDLRDSFLCKKMFILSRRVLVSVLSCHYLLIISKMNPPYTHKKQDRKTQPPFVEKM